MTDIAEQHDMWKAMKLKEAKELAAIDNPCVRTFGAGPDGMKCKTCSNLYGRQYSKTYWKCKLRKETRGRGSDHRVNWPACSKYMSMDRERSALQVSKFGELSKGIFARRLMQQKTGKIYENPTDDDILQKQLTRLQNHEYDLVKDLPESDRPAALALQRYLEDRAKLGRTGIGVQEKMAFKLGFKAGQDSANAAEKAQT